jgi:anti-sigma factor RsiW
MSLNEAQAMTENTERTTNGNLDESGWGECPGGEISGMVDRLARQQKMAVSAKISAVAAALLIGTGIWFSLQSGHTNPTAPQQANTPEGEYQFGEICCSDVAQYAAAFNKGELDEEKTAQIRQHIASCPHCGKEFEASDAEPQTSIGHKSGQMETTALTHSMLLIAGR